MIHIIYVDDEQNNPLTLMIEALFTSDGEVKCKLRSPPSDLSEITNWKLDILFIDFDLASAKVDDKLIGYSGNSLASEVRNRHPLCPIVLVSRKEALNTRGHHISTSTSDFDLILYKDEILQNREKAKREVFSLYAGFKKLAAIANKPWSLVLALIGTTQEESRSIREAFPPIEKDHKWYIPAAAEWIRNVLLHYPGILYDELHAAARLGISQESFRRKDVQEYFEQAIYTGVFREFGERWWGGRLLGVASNLMAQTELSGPISFNFRLAFSNAKQIQLEPSICTVDGKPTADQICYVLNEPVKRENSILYYPDSRPPIMDAARVSLKAIREKSSFDEDLVDAESYDIVQELWET